MSSIKGYIQELEGLKNEIKRNNLRNRELNKRVKIIEESIKNFLTSKQQSGIKYNDVAIVMENKERKTTKKKQELENDIMRVLSSLGIQDTRTAYEVLEAARKNDNIQESKLKFKKIKQ